jgi:hypothetical protein
MDKHKLKTEMSGQWRTFRSSFSPEIVVLGQVIGLKTVATRRKVGIVSSEDYRVAYHEDEQRAKAKLRRKCKPEGKS